VLLDGFCRHFDALDFSCNSEPVRSA